MTKQRNEIVLLRDFLEILVEFLAAETNLFRYRRMTTSGEILQETEIRSNDNFRSGQGSVL